MAPSGRKIAILDCARLDAPKLARHNSIGELVANWLQPAMNNVELVRVPIAYGVPFPAIQAYDGYILPGSEHGVYEATPWMKPLAAFLHSIRRSGRPLFGICFGHQMMAHTFGGRAAKAALGLCTGVRRYTVNGEQIDAHVMHQDQVVEVPSGAEVVGSADYCPVGALSYDFPAQSIQFHPEYTPAFMADAVDALEGQLLSRAEAAAARESLTAPVRHDLYASTVAAFFRDHFPAFTTV